MAMAMKICIVLFLLLILTYEAACSDKKRYGKCRWDKGKILSADEGNSTSDHYYYNCDPSEFGIVQEIPYTRPASGCGTIQIDFSSSCIRCGMCLAIAEKVNQTLLDVHEILPTGHMSETEVGPFLRTTCDHCFQRLRELCHYYLDQIGESQLYEEWLQWCDDEENYPNLTNVMCRNVNGILRDCRRIYDLEQNESPRRTYNARVKFTAWFDRHGKHE